jgi:hypothetical protein
MRVLVSPIGCVTGLIVLSCASYSLWLTLAQGRQIDTPTTELEFFVPIILSLIFLSFLSLW